MLFHRPGDGLTVTHSISTSPTNRRNHREREREPVATHPDCDCFLLIELESPLGALGEVVDDAVCVLGGRLHGGWGTIGRTGKRREDEGGQGEDEAVGDDD
jgi:hypothetical protein